MALSFLILVLWFAASPTAAPARIEWLPSLDAALEEAKRDGKPVFIAINMDNERANDEVIRQHYKDPTLIKLASRTAALFASKHDHGSGERPCARSGVVTCAQHMQAEKQMRQRFLESQGDSTIAPQHLWISPAGSVILSVPYRISKGEMEWCFVSALRAVDSKFSWKLSGAARAPKRLVMGGVSATSLDLAATPPPTKKEVEQIIEELRKVRRPWESNSDVLRLILSSDKKAIDYIRTLLSGRTGGRGGRGGGGGGGGGGEGGEGGEGGGGGQNWKGTLLHSIGRYAPEEYWEIVVPCLSDNNVMVRREASVAIEQLAAPKALGELTKRFQQEEEVDVQKELIRAIGSCGRATTKGVKMVTQQANKAKNPLVRINAVVAAALLEDREAVLDLAKSGLLSELGGVRAVAGYLIAIRREGELKPLLESALAGETDASIKAALEAARNVLNGAPVTELDPVLRDFAASDILRDRP